MKYYKCPYCLRSFRRKTARSTINDNGYQTYYCPYAQIAGGEKACGSQLPNGFFKGRSKVIAIVGGVNVGKTVYIVALLRQLLKNDNLAGMDISGDLVGKKEDKQYFYDRIAEYEKGEPFEPTKRFFEAHKKALVFDVAIKNTFGRGFKHIYLSFFDTPGEGLSSMQYMQKEMACLYRADGLILLIEPLQIKHLRKSIILQHKYVEDQRPEDLKGLLNRIISLMLDAQENTLSPKAMEAIRQARFSMAGNRQRPEEDERNNVPAGRIRRQARIISSPWNWLVSKLSSNGTVKCPVAIGITKIDQMRHLLSHDIPFDHEDFKRKYVRHGLFNTRLIYKISKDLRKIILENREGGEGFKKQLEQIREYEFFGIKSGDVDENGDIVNISTPQGVFLPLIWILITLKLYKNG